ncbi:MAG: pilus assembly protein [Anaerolineae bacterium]|nr:pilus assembly protein [Anaerolineae bacterium]
MHLWSWLATQPAVQRKTWGQGLVEYALLLIFVAVVLIALLVILGPGISNVYGDIISEL